MKDSFTKKSLISLSLILVSIIIAAGALYYFSNDLAAQSSKIAAEQQNVNNQANSLGALASLESQAPKTSGYASAMDQLLPTQYAIINFNSWLSTIGQKYGVTATSQFSGNATPATPSTPGSIAFSLSVSGPIGSVEPFLKNIESVSPGFILDLSSFDYTSDGSTEKLNAQGNLFFK